MFVELVGGEIAEGLVWPIRFVPLVPGEESVFEGGAVFGQVVDVVELVVVGAEGAFDAPVALGVVGAVEVVVEGEPGDGVGELPEELGAAVGLDGLDGEGEPGEGVAERVGASATTRLRVKKSIAPNWKTVLPPGS